MLLLFLALLIIVTGCQILLKEYWICTGWWILDWLKKTFGALIIFSILLSVFAHIMYYRETSIVVHNIRALGYNDASISGRGDIRQFRNSMARYEFWKYIAQFSGHVFFNINSEEDFDEEWDFLIKVTTMKHPRNSSIITWKYGKPIYFKHHPCDCSDEGEEDE